MVSMTYKVDGNPIFKRNMCWDVLPCEDAQHGIELMGLNRGSEEGNDLEHRQSHARLAELETIADVVSILSSFAGEVAGRGILDVQGVDIDPEDEDDVGTEYLNHYMAFAQAVVPAVLANLIQQGVIYLTDEGSLFI